MLRNRGYFNLNIFLEALGSMERIFLKTTTALTFVLEIFSSLWDNESFHLALPRGWGEREEMALTL